MKEKGGYECEFVEPPPKQLQSECSICLLVLREPQIVSCCGNNFCETCIGRVQRDGKPCPLCNEPGFTTVANGSLKRSLSEFQVRCPHRELGCEWVDQLGKLDQHLNADPQPERQLEGCPFASIKCIHCKDHMRRHVIAGHQNECPKRPYTCEYCEEYESTFEDVINHLTECKCYRLPCPNNCNASGSGIERQNLEHHVKEECPLTVVECDFHYAGCGVKRPRKDMAVHMKEESVAHISLLAAENQRLAKQLLEREQQLLERDEQLQIQQSITTQRLCHLEENTENLTINYRDIEDNVTLTSQRLTNNHKKLKGEIRNLQALYITSVLVLVAFGSVLYYSMPEHPDNITQYHREHQDLVANVTREHRDLVANVTREHRDLVTNVTQEHRDLVANVTQHHREHRDLVANVTQHHREHRDLVANVTREHRDLVTNVTQHHREYQDLVADVTRHHREHRDLVADVTRHHREHQDLVERVTQDFSIQFQTAYGEITPVDIEMCEISSKGTTWFRSSEWYSPPFYTHMFGYKFCLRVDVNGFGDGKGTHVSVFSILMRGEFDSLLEWPFRGIITVHLLRHKNIKRNTKTYTALYTDKTDDDIAGQVTVGERAHHGLGKEKFVPHSELDNYLKNDCLNFQILTSVRLQ